MGLNQIDTFMGAIRNVESGSVAGKYDAIGPTTPEGNRARGAYQIMEQFWDSWASDAGIPGADWRSRAAQDHVARYKFTQYYNKYRDWALVAIAWFKGPGIADQAQNNGMLGVLGITDRTTGTSIENYIAKVMDVMGEQPATPGPAAPPTPPPADYHPDLSSLTGPVDAPAAPLQRNDPDIVLQGMFTAMSEMVRRNASAFGDDVNDLSERDATLDGDDVAPTAPQEVVGDIA